MTLLVALLTLLGCGEPAPPATCLDGKLNGEETDLDCGGPCAPCAAGATCDLAVDCVSAICLNSVCAPSTCDDDVLNGKETAVDCGGGVCPPCVDGLTCLGAWDCASGVCTDGSCVPPACTDGIHNGEESDRDCGGPCEGCADGATCELDADCGSGACIDGACVDPTCTDGFPNGAETGLDCGGDCPGCGSGQPCTAPDDCADGVCEQGTCQLPACDDGVANGTETGLDCGGDCGGCAIGAGCAGPRDCASGTCVSGECAAASCIDGVLDGSEVAQDCGGPDCPGCPPSSPCLRPADCAEGVCTGGTCAEASCTDGVANGAETGLDCGGPCNPCPLGSPCHTPDDCVDGVCDGTCALPTCADDVHNGDELAVDCGGACPGCGPGTSCAGPEDCASGRCESELCVAGTCTDSLQNGDETWVDCGGSCDPCPVYALCEDGADCAEGVCTDGTCRAPTCQDGVENGEERGVDCDGTCPYCWWDEAWPERVPLHLDVESAPAGTEWVQTPIDIDTICYGFELPDAVYSFHFSEGIGDSTSSRDGSGLSALLDHGGSFTTGHDGGGYAFDGDDWIELPDHLVPSGNTFTAALWYRLTGTHVGNPYLIGSWKDGEIFKVFLEDASGCHQTTGTGMRFAGDVHPVGRGEPNLCSDTSPSIGAWSFVTFTFDGRTARLYVDGVEHDAFDFGSTESLGDFSDVELGTNRDHAHFAVGVMDDVLLLEEALTAGQVQALMDPACRRDLADLRFYDATTGQVLWHWVESDERVWLRAPAHGLPPHEIYLYYGNEAAADTSDAEVKTYHSSPSSFTFGAPQTRP